MQLTHYAFLLKDDLYVATYHQLDEDGRDLDLLVPADRLSDCVLHRALEPVKRNLLMMGVMLPFWTSFLIRVYAWIGILKNDGLLNTFADVDRR